jgi:hypothetical protein
MGGVLLCQFRVSAANLLCACHLGARELTQGAVPIRVPIRLDGK